MRILSGTAICSAEPGSNVYTRALAREWMRVGHDVTIVCQERHPEHYDLGGARVVVPELPGRSAARVRARRVRGARGAAAAGLHASASATLRGSERGGAARARSGRRRLRESRAAGRAGRTRRAALPLRREGARLGARVLDARPSRARALGRRVARDADAVFVGSRAHPRGARGCRRPRRPRARGAAGSRRRRVRARGARRRARRADRGVATATRPTATSAIPTPGTPNASRPSSPTTRRRSSSSES